MTETLEYDVMVLRAGSGGYAAAIRATQLGFRVALVEGDEVDGTCLHHGYIPVKAPLHAAEVTDGIRGNGSIGAHGSFGGIDMNTLNSYKDDVVQRMCKELTGLMASRSVEMASGWDRLATSGTVDVDGTLYRGRNVILASRSFSKTLGLKVTGCIITSSRAPNIDRVPSSMIILGGGIVGVEFASMQRLYGVDMTIIEGLPSLIPDEDPPVPEQLERSFRRCGVKFSTKTVFECVGQDELPTTVHT